jgi:hypothetical protein
MEEKRMKYRAWIMLHSHAFVRAEGNTIKDLRKDIDSKYEDTYVFEEGGREFKGTEVIAGWGRVSIKGLDPDMFNAFGGLNSRDKLKDLTKENFKKEIKSQISGWVETF